MPPTIRSIIALIGGFAIMTFSVMVLTILAAWVFGVMRGEPTPPYLAASIVLSAISAAAGGYSTAALAPGRALAHAAGLAVMVLVLGVYSALNPQPGQPLWYLAALAAIGPVFALAGGALATRRRRGVGTGTAPAAPTGPPGAA
jgi:hypothetical protein